MDGYTPRPRPVVQAVGDIQPAAPRPKQHAAWDLSPAQSLLLRDMCRLQCCAMCGRDGPDAGVTWAHGNLGNAGKGLGLKSIDVYVAALCWVCHAELDQGKAWSAEQKARRWFAAWIKTIERALEARTWPPGVRLPDEFITYQEGMHAEALSALAGCA